MLEKQVKIVYLGIGSNLGDRVKNIRLSIFELYLRNIQILQKSSFYESLSWPDPKKPKFINIILKIETNLDPLSLLKICKKIEFKLGRKNSEKNAPRICDIDIIDYDRKIVNNGVILPHPSMMKRNFVLLPFFEITKSWKHPKNNKNLANLINSLPLKDLKSITQL